MKKEAEFNARDLKAEWKTAQSKRKPYTTDFKDLDQLVDGVPLNKQKDAPFVGDTTLPGLVRQIPRSSLQQLPVFAAIINGSKLNYHGVLSSYFLRKAVFNKRTFGKGLLSTLQIGAEQGLTHGYAPFMCTAGTQLNSPFGTTMRLMHYNDVDPEPGTSDSSEFSYVYVVANVPKSRIKKIHKSAKKNPETTWIVKSLEKLLEESPRSKDYSMDGSDPRKNANSSDYEGTYEIVTKYETGPGGKFVTFCPQLDDEDGILRVVENRSKFGFPRVQFLVIDPVALHPYGLSRVRLASPNQNMMNIYYQNLASMLLLNSRPPVLQRGRFTTPIQLKQNARWVTLDNTAKAELVTMDNGALDKFVPFAQQFSAQIQNMMGTPTGGLNGNSNAFGFSKTGPGVKEQSRMTDLSTNQITNILENFLTQYALTALDTYISEQSGDDDLIVDDECKDELNRLNPDTVGEDNIVSINWEDFYGAIKDIDVEVELSLTKDELTEKKREDMQDTVTVLAQNAEQLGGKAAQRVDQLTDKLVEDMVPEVAKMPVAPTPSPEQSMGMPPMQ